MQREQIVTLAASGVEDGLRINFYECQSLKQSTRNFTTQKL